MNKPSTAASGPPQVHPLLRGLGKAWLRACGWKAQLDLPEVSKAVCIAAPHTSNWDLPFALACSWALGVKLSWAGKHTLFRFPFGGFMRFLGGVPVDRRVRANQVDRIAAIIEELDAVYMAVAPSGTRSKRDHWKSGFYYIAAKADVPILMAYLDYGKKIGGFGPLLHTTDDIRRDMDTLRAFYADKTGLYPENMSTMRLKEETPSS